VVSAGRGQPQPTITQEHRVKLDTTLDIKIPGLLVQTPHSQIPAVRNRFRERLEEEHNSLTPVGRNDCPGNPTRARSIGQQAQKSTCPEQRAVFLVERR